MKYISLFSGIGGFELGIHQASEKMGIELECVFSSEIDKYARQIYEKNFGVEPYGDITRINEETIPDHDLLVSGFPCQSFSIAGKRCGFEDTRGTLFFEIARIARAKGPEILLLENVRGLLSHDKGRTFETILKTLDDIGYDVEWQVLNSKNYGVPQNRERVFIIGHLRGSSRRKIFPITGENRQVNNKSINENRQLIAIDNGKLINKKISNCLDANYYKGLDCHQQRTGVMIKEATKNRIRRLTPIECERLQGFPDNWTEGISDSQRYKCLGNAVSVPVIEAIITELFKE